MDSERYIEATIDGVTYKFPEELHYSKDGLWVSVNGQIGRVGVGDYLYRCISPSLSFIEAHPPGTEVRQGEAMGSFELVKAEVPIPSPVTGIIEEINDDLMSNLWLLDSDPYGEGWLAFFRLSDFASDRRDLMDADAYRAMLEMTVKPSLADER